MGLTRYLTAFYDELAKTLRLRLITPDRPGVGESEPCLDGSGTPLNWADDVAIICNHLGITKFSLLAHSAGAIYALATALRMPQQIRGQLRLETNHIGFGGIISGMALNELNQSIVEQILNLIITSRMLLYF